VTSNVSQGHVCNIQTLVRTYFSEDKLRRQTFYRWCNRIMWTVVSVACSTVIGNSWNEIVVGTNLSLSYCNGIIVALICCHIWAKLYKLFDLIYN